MRERECAECGRRFRPRAVNTDFCRPLCRQTFNNRRALRGSVLYDLAMIRVKGTLDDAGTASRLIEAYIADCIEQDNGRRTYRRAIDTFMGLTHLLAEKIRG